jgi:hypothetical protein
VECGPSGAYRHQRHQHTSGNLATVAAASGAAVRAGGWGVVGRRGEWRRGQLRGRKRVRGGVAGGREGWRREGWCWEAIGIASAESRRDKLVVCMS